MIVKVGYSGWYHGMGDFGFMLTQDATLQDITEIAINYACEAMSADTSKVLVMPVYLVNSHHAPYDGTQKKIGLVRMSMLDMTVKVEHLTLNEKVINSDWAALDFYSGKYGLAND